MQYILTVVCSLLIFSNLAWSQPQISIKKIRGNDERGQFNLEYIELGKTLGTQRREAANRLLYQDMISDKLCSADPTNKHKMHSKSVVQLKYSSKHLLSFTSNVDIYCAGPYPDSAILYSTYDLNTAKRIELLKEGRNEKQLKKLIREQFIKQKPSLSKDCNDLFTQKASSDLYVQFFIEQGQLIIRQEYPHVIRACEYDITISCCNLIKLLKKESPLANFCQPACTTSG